MSSGFQYNRKRAASTIKYWVLKEELPKRQIAIIDFAKALGVTTGVLTGAGSTFPAAKVERVVELLKQLIIKFRHTKCGTTHTYISICIYVCVFCSYIKFAVC